MKSDASTITLAHVNPRHAQLGAALLTGTAAVWTLLPVQPGFDCPLRTLTGLPCPFCGMTRACIAAEHGHVLQSLAFNPGGIVVMLAALVLLVRPTLLQRVRAPLWAALGVLATMWVWNIGFNPTFHQLLWR